jgi:hypothetical protein
MKEHLDRHTNPARVRENDAVVALNSMFRKINCFCLPHPGFQCQDEGWNGRYTDLSPNFVRFVDLYFREVFHGSLSSKTVSSIELTPLSFDLMIKGFMTAFKDAAPNAVTFMQAIQNNSTLMAKEKAMKSYGVKMDKFISANPNGTSEQDFTQASLVAVAEVHAEFKQFLIFGGAQVRERTWSEIRQSLKTLEKRYHEDNARRFEKVLAAFAPYALLGWTLFVLDRVSDWVCDWFSKTCRDLSMIMLIGYSLIFLNVGVHAYFVFQDRGKIAFTNAVCKLWSEMMRLLVVYSEIALAVKPSEIPALLRSRVEAWLGGEPRDRKES